MSLEFAYLADRVDAVPVVARWYFDEWGDLRPGDSLSRTQDRLREFMNRDAIPCLLLAIEDGEPIAAVQLKRHEMEETFPDKTNWLGGLYVAPAHRGNGYGALLVERIAGVARSCGVPTLHLQTEAPDGGLYARLGWQPCARAKNHGRDVLVMERRL